MRRLVLTHFSQRYREPTLFRDEAADVYGGDLVVAADLQTVPVPPRRGPADFLSAEAALRARPGTSHTLSGRPPPHSARRPR